MTGRLLCGVALVAHVLVLVICTDPAAQASSPSTSETSPVKSDSDKGISPVKPQKGKCQRVRKCPKNEEFSYCSQLLIAQRAQHCSEKGQPYRSSAPDTTTCKEGCVCKENYLRNDNGTCIPAEKCPITCGDNEVLDNCPADCDSDYCPTEESKKGSSCVKPDPCPPPSCKCAFNHRRASNGTCIPTRSCPAFDCSARPNEEFDPCPPLCPTDDCSQASPTGKCPQQFGRIGIVLICNPKCRCMKGYWRLDGVCVPYGQCPGVCPTNERYSECIQAECRALNCTQKDQSVPCVRLDPKFCLKGCVCEEGYLRDENGVCVPQDQCPNVTEPNTCPPNEELSDCANALCQPLNCTDRGLSIPCPLVVNCTKECVCKYNFLRDENGICVPKEQCPTPTCPPNEQFLECIQAICRAQTCNEKDSPILCPRIPEGSCLEGCVCQEGYLRDDNGDCIAENECKPKTCPPNEEWSECVDALCRPLLCEDRGLAFSCSTVEYCAKECVCKPNFFRDENDVCVPKEQCPPPTCPPNEQFSNCSQAICRAQFCNDMHDPVDCPSIPEEYCLERCVCQEGFLRDDNGDCIAKNECKPITCPPNEEWSECVDALCRPLLCEDRGLAFSCSTVEYCAKECVCKQNFFRDENDVCVPKEQCPPPTCPPNEQFSNCSQAICRAQFCNDMDDPIDCPSIPEGSCLERCVCQEGYLRDWDGNCIAENECMKLYRFEKNQEVRSVQPCTPEGTCRNRGLAVSCVPSPYEYKLVCKPGFVKDDNEECIPEEQCPGPCEQNEEFSNCTQAICRAQNCSDKGNPQACSSVADGDCLQGCVCQAGYLRTEDGYCVPEEQCSIECGTNQELRCVQPCPPEDSCRNRALGVAVSCMPSPCEYKCVCKSGFIRNYKKECILEEQCDKSCSPYEEWSDCMHTTCRAQYCTQKGMPVDCPETVDGDCISGCICKEKFLRDESGFCVPEEECKEEEGPNTCPPNEELSYCANAQCGPLDCKDRGLDLPCPSVTKCLKGCVCKYNFLRDENGVCVPKEQCPTPTCPPNEQFSNCTQALCRTHKCNDKDTPSFCPTIPKELCLEGCVCQEGYLRDDNGNCIDRNECKQCGTNQLLLCVNPCPPEETCRNRGLAFKCMPSRCEYKCVCITGFVKDDNDECIRKNQCAGTCPPNEELSVCANALCRPQNCTQRGLSLPCPMVTACNKECVCKENFLRDKNGDCIPEEQCPPQITCKENEELESCPSKCTSDSCPKSANEEDVCLPSSPCSPACKCKFNYRRAENGTCIPTSSCPPFDCSNLPNEEYVACPSYCPGDECGQPRLTGRCPFKIGVRLECSPKCQCKDGYGRVNGTCVPFEECPNLCPANETYSPCIENTCRPQNCSDRDLKIETCSNSTATSSQRGCVCKENYFRNDQGVCVSYEECGGPLCPNANEVYTANFKECPPNTCSSLVARYPCDANQKEGPGCLCAPGYLRLNVTSPCIPLCDCPEMANSPDCLE